jgi:hypothetical protein
MTNSKSGVIKLARMRRGGNPVTLRRTTLDPRLRGDDSFPMFRDVPEAFATHAQTRDRPHPTHQLFGNVPFAFASATAFANSSPLL